MDIRERETMPSGWSADHRRMVLIDDHEGLEYRAEYVVCVVCNGRGSHVNPAIDSQGLSSEDFAQDPDFAEGYFSGVYDVQCSGCLGRRVALWPLDEDGEAAYLDAWQVAEDSRAEYEAERRFGC